MKRLISILLCFSLLFALCACSAQKDNEESKSNESKKIEESKKFEESANLDNESTESIDTSNLVTDAFNKTIGEGKFAIPKINIDSDNCNNINEEIWDTLYNKFVNEKTPDECTSYDYTSYEWVAHKGVLSLLI